MSLIHQMLRDLDARRVPLAATQASALRGMGLLPARRTGNGVLRHLLPVIALIVAGALVAFTLRLLLSPATTGPETMPPVQAAPAGMPLAQAVMSARAETVLAGPPPATDSITTPAQHPSPALQGKTRTARQHPDAPRRNTDGHSAPPPPAQAAETGGTTSDARLSATPPAPESGPGLRVVPHRPTADRHSEALIEHAGRALRAGHDALAVNLLQQALAIAPDRHEARLHLAGLLASRGEPRRALELIQAAIENGAADAATLALAAGIHYRLQQPELAEQRYRAALALDNTPARWWMGLGLSLEAQTKPRAAAAAYRRAMRGGLEPQLAQYVSERLEALTRQEP